MNWKIVGKALAATIGLFIVITVMVLLMWKFHIWVTVTILFLAVFWLIYDSMKRSYYNGNDNDRLSWNSDYDEDEEGDEK